MSTNNEVISDSLKILLKNKEMNIHQMSKECNIPVNDLESALDRKGLSFENAIHIVEKLGISYEELAGGEQVATKEYFGSDVSKQFQEGLKSILSNENITQTEIVEQFKNKQDGSDVIGKTTITNAFSGKNISLKTMKILSNEYDVSFDYLFGNSQDYRSSEHIFRAIKSHIGIHNLNIIEKASNYKEITGELHISSALFSYFKSINEISNSEMSDELKELSQKEAESRFLNVIKKDTEIIKFDFNN